MRIGLYINQITRLRDDVSREPDPAFIAALAETAGAQPILVGWVSQGTGINERDICMMRELIHGDMLIVTPLDLSQVEPTIKLQPEGVVLTSSSWDGVSPAHPVQAEHDIDIISGIVSNYRQASVPVSLFLDPTLSEIKAVARSGVTGVVLNCLEYATARSDEEAITALDKITDAAVAANKFGLTVAAAHGLNYRNIAPVSAVRFIDELYIGRAIVGRSLVCGLESAIGKLEEIIHHYRTGS